jgi:hypothetical protein
MYGARSTESEQPPNVRHVMTYRSTGFVNAQYRFVMKPSGDYTVHFADPDMYVIVLYATEALSVFQLLSMV